MLHTLRRLWLPTDSTSAGQDLPAEPARRSFIAQAPLAVTAGLVGGAVAAGYPTDAAAKAATSARADAPLEDGFIHFADQRERFKALFRLERDLRDEGTALSTYQFLIYALPQGERPQPVVRFEGMEFSYFRRIGDLTWRIHAHNVSYPRDLQTGDFTSTARNPFTGETLPVQPMKLLGDPGVLHSPQGYLPLDAKQALWLDTYLSLRVEGDLIKAEHIRPTPDGWPQMFIESSCGTVSRKDYDNPRVTSLACQTAGFYVFPFPKWMQMGDRAGHMLGAWNGRKIASPGGLPRTFQERLRRENPELLLPRWAEHDRPLPELLRTAYAR